MKEEITDENIIEAHKHSSSNQPELMRSTICGCFWCLRTFKPEEIEHWFDEVKGGMTAQCPHCAIDSVIGDASGYPITCDFLDRMNLNWFNGYRHREVE